MPLILSPMDLTNQIRSLARDESICQEHKMTRLSRRGPPSVATGLS